MEFPTQKLVNPIRVYFSSWLPRRWRLGNNMALACLLVRESRAVWHPLTL
jgi:hypothetical protein